MNLHHKAAWIITLLAIFLTSNPVFSQNTDTANIDIKQIEKRINNKEKLTETKQQLQILSRQAKKQGDDFLFTRAVSDLIRIKDLRTEDSLYFKNSAIIDTLLASNKQTKTSKAILHILRAQRISNFTRRGNKFNYAVYRSSQNYALLSYVQRDSLALNDLDTALNIIGVGKSGKKLLWVSSQPDIFLLEPELKDIVFAEMTDVLSNYNQVSVPDTCKQWLSLSSTDIRNQINEYNTAYPGKQNAIKVFGNWIKYHWQSPATAMYIESLFRKYIYLIFSYNRDNLRDTYINYLQQSTTSPYPAVKAHAVYQLCLMWNEDANKYVKFDGWQYNFDEYNFDEKYRPSAVKALNLYQSNKALMLRYPVLNNVLYIMESQILSRGVRVEMESRHLPDTEIPFRAMYRNTDTLFYRVVKLNYTEPYGRTTVIATDQLLNRPAVQEGNFALPLPPDHNRHAVYLKLKGLPAGRYQLLFNTQPINTKNAALNRIVFDVTGIAAVNTDEHVFILDRKTGFPLKGAIVNGHVYKKPAFKNLSYVVPANGCVAIEDANHIDSLTIINNSDTVGYRFGNRVYKLDEDIYDDELYDNLVEYYDDNAEMSIFTDRSIYRPGQTVHYKIIFLTKNPDTGQPILLNPKNLGKELLKKWLDDANDEIELKNPFGKKIDSARIKINEYGTFAGSFVLPKTAATGEWEITGIPETNYNNDGSFRVEEYKRPTIDLSMEKQTETLVPGRAFEVHLKLRSFSGAQPANIQINYKITRQGYKPIAKGRYDDYYPIEILSGKKYTNEKGELIIPVYDSVLAKTALPDSVEWNYTYSVHATAVDVTGESSEIHEYIKISSRPVSITMAVEQAYDIQSFPGIKVSTSTINEGLVAKKVQIKLYKLSKPERHQIKKKEVDVWYYNRNEWNKWFPDKAALNDAEKKNSKTLVLDTIVDTANGKLLNIKKSLLNVAYYELTASVIDSGHITGYTEVKFTVFDTKADKSPAGSIDYMPYNFVKNGENVTWYTSADTATYAIYQILYTDVHKKLHVENIYRTETINPGISKWQFTVPAYADQEIHISRISVKNGNVTASNKLLYIDRSKMSPIDIIIAKYRKVMAPGARETFSLSVKTKDTDVAAEIMTALYDASLDKLEDFKWRVPLMGHNYHLYPDWNYFLSSKLIAGNYQEGQDIDITRVRPQIYNTLAGRLPGFFSSQSSEGLNEVVVMGVGEKKTIRTYATANVFRIRGVSSLSDYKQPLVILDGEVFSGDLKSLNVNSIIQIAILKGAEATALYGAKAVNGVLVISTKGTIVFPGAEEQPIKIRKNFNETAFFYPQLHAGKDGYYTFTFTMPESATEWNWKIMAHTLDARFALIEKKLQTQLSLMVQPNMPRQLHQGDKIKLKSRVSNLDTAAITGNATCKIEDAVTGKDITAHVVDKTQQPFKLDKKSSGAVSFWLTIPAQQLNPLKVIITVSGNGMSDGEEHTIPLLSSKVFVRQSTPVNLSAGQTLNVTPVKLPADARVYGAALSIQQKPQSALLYALPWLANYPYNCAEQTFNKLRANVTALMLMRNDTSAQLAFSKAQQFVQYNKTEEDELPDELAETSMPWLHLSNQNQRNLKQLFNLLDTSKTSGIINTHKERLYSLQQPDGGLSWFEGGTSNRYISAYVLAGFGQLKKMGWLPQNNRLKPELFFDQLQKFVGTPSSETDSPFTELFELYALSYWTDINNLSVQEVGRIHGLLKTEWKSVASYNLSRQALLIINSLRYNDVKSPMYKMALQQLENIRQQAIDNPANGLRWKDIADTEDMSTSAEETMALLAEAFEASGSYNDTGAGIVKWLLATKQTEHWQTTKATASAINMLQKQPGGSFGQTKTINANFEDKQLTVNDDLLSGDPLAFTKLSQQPTSIKLNSGNNTVSGSVSWFYFTGAQHLDTLNKVINIKKEFYLYNIEKKAWEIFTGNTTLKAGNKVKVKLIFNTDRQLKFVHINDPRAAAFEPDETMSGYRYQNGFSYYQSVRDTGVDLFTENLPRGISTLTYELIVAHTGQFTSGPVHLQCMYQPDLTAYSNSFKINVQE